MKAAVKHWVYKIEDISGLTVCLSASQKRKSLPQDVRYKTRHFFEFGRSISEYAASRLLSLCKTVSLFYCGSRWFVNTNRNVAHYLCARKQCVLLFLVGQVNGTAVGHEPGYVPTVFVSRTNLLTLNTLWIACWPTCF